MTFQQWIEENSPKNADIKGFQEEMKTLNIDLSEMKALLELKNAISGSDLDQDKKDALIKQVKALWDTYKPTEKPDSCRSNGSGMSTRDKMLVVGGVLILVIVSMILWHPRLLESLAKPAFARGMITFLFAFGTIGIALIITISVFTSIKDEKESKERFYRAKEILTILIGILGTIVGFYFGAPTNSETDTAVKSLALSVPVYSTEAPLVGESLTISAQITGGTPPYVYSLALISKNDAIHEVKDKPSKDGQIRATFVMEKKTGSYAMKTQLTVEDSTGASATLTGAKFQVKEKPDQ